MPEVLAVEGKRKRRRIQISTSLTVKQDEEIEGLILRGYFLSRSEFIRAAVKAQLEKELKEEK